MKNTLMEGINKIVKTDLNKSEKINILQYLLSETINVISSELDIEPINNKRKFHIGKVKGGFGVSYNIKRTENDIIMSDRVFELRKTTIIQNLIYLIVKESFMHFIQMPISEIIELLINFTAILWIQKHFKIRNFENAIIVTINRNIYPKILAGKDTFHFWFLMELLFKKNIDFKIVYNKTIELSKESSINEFSIEQQFSTWVYQLTIKEEDVLSPILIQKNKEPIIEYLIKKGYKNSSASELAVILGKSERSILKAVRVMSSKLTIFWLPVINYEKIRLHNYYLIIRIHQNGEMNKIQKLLTNIPYLKSLYNGSSDKQNVLYSPTLICPHIVANNLKERLVELENKNHITSFTLQLFKEKFSYCTMSTSKNEFLKKPSIETYNQLLSNNIPKDFKLKKYILNHEIREISPVFDDTDVLDYNLLYFISFLRQKYLLTGSYGGWIHELPKLLEKNNKSLARMSEAVTFLSQIEHRATRRGFLSFYFFIRNIMYKNPNILIIDTPLIEANESIVNKTHIFGFLYQFQLSDRSLFVLPGISHTHPIAKLLRNAFENEGISASFYTVNSLMSKFVPLHDLFDYEEQKWKI